MPAYNLPIYINLYQLNKSLQSAVKNFPKEKKYTLGEDILNKNWECLDLVIGINTLTGNQKIKSIINLSIAFDCLKVRLRMAEEIGLISEKQYAHIQKKYIEEIGNMIGGWMKWIKQKEQ